MWSIPKEKLLEFVETSNSIKELVGKIGLNNKSGSNDLTIKRCLEYHGIDWKPLALKGVRYSQQNVNKRRILTNNEIFIEHSDVARNVARQHILKDNLIPYKCAICGQEPEWNGKPMTLILDHINGVRDDHRLENLRFVCGNCNMQLETTSGNKNTERRKELSKEIEKTRSYVKNGSNKLNKCPICGKLKDVGAGTCLTCYLKQKAEKSKRPSKNELIQDILELPILQIGKKYGVSDNAVRRWLRKYNLPVTRNEIKEFRNNWV